MACHLWRSLVFFDVSNVRHDIVLYFFFLKKGDLQISIYKLSEIKLVFIAIFFYNESFTDISGFCASSSISSATITHLLKILFANGARVILVPEIRTELSISRGQQIPWGQSTVYDLTDVTISTNTVIRPFVRSFARVADAHPGVSPLAGAQKREGRSEGGRKRERNRKRALRCLCEGD